MSDLDNIDTAAAATLHAASRLAAIRRLAGKGFHELEQDELGTQLEQVQEARRMLDHLQHELVIGMYLQGQDWNWIALALGVPRQAAHKRYAEACKAAMSLTIRQDAAAIRAAVSPQP